MATQYDALADVLQARIERGDDPIGSRIPSERALCELYQVSRITVRRAIGELVARGLLVRRQGSGTFVAAPVMEHSLFDRLTFYDELRRRGMLVASRVLGIETVATGACDPAVAQGLRLRASDEVLRVTRLRTVDGEPYAVETNHMSASMVPWIEPHLIASRSLYEILAADFALVAGHASEFFEPIVLDAVRATDLDVEPGSPGLLLHRTTYDAARRPYETSTAAIRGDRCRMLIEIWLERTAGIDRVNAKAPAR